jgi:hypothetical protein
MKTLCIDFDGVLHSYTHGWKGVERVDDPPVPGAIKFLLDCLASGFNVCIYSSRSKEEVGLEAMHSALHLWYCEEKFGDGDDADRFLDQLSFPTEKPPAWLTIDDRAICFNGTFPAMEEMHNFKPWNK